MGLLDDAIREHLELKRRRGADAGDISRQESEALGPVRRGPDGEADLSETVVPGEAAAEAPTPAESEETGVLSSPPSAYEPPTVTGREPPPTKPPVHEPPPVSDYEPPRPPVHEPPPVGEPPPPRASYEPPKPPSYEPGPDRPRYEPPPVPTHEPRTTRTSDPEPEHERRWFEPHLSLRRPAQEPAGEPDDPGADHPSLLSRLRPGRKSKHEPEPPEPPSSREPPRSRADVPPPPPPPVSTEPPSAYEPPPAPPARAYEPPPAHHEPDIVPADEEPDVEDVLEETPDFLEETPEHDRLWFEQRPPRDFDFDD